MYIRSKKTRNKRVGVRPQTYTHIYLDTVPPTDVVWNDVATDKLTTQDGDKLRMGSGVVADVRATPHRLTPVLPRHTT